MYTNNQTKMTELQSQMAKLKSDMEEEIRKEKEIKDYEQKIATHTEPNLRFMEEWLEKSIYSQREWYIEGIWILNNPNSLRLNFCTYNKLYMEKDQYKEQQERAEKKAFNRFSTEHYIFMYHSHPKMSEFLEKINDKKSILTNENTKLYNERKPTRYQSESRRRIDEKIKNNRKFLDIINKEHQEITDKITEEIHEVRTFFEPSSNSQFKFVQSVYNMFKIQQEKIDKLEKEIERIKTV